MLLYLDKENRIMAINSTERTDLTEVKVDETSEMFPFTGWSAVRICCYKIGYEYQKVGTEEQTIKNEETNEEELVEVPIYSEFANITMMTPYVPTHMMSAIEQVGRQSENNKSSVSELQDYTADLLYQVCLLQLGVTEEDL